MFLLYLLNKYLLLLLIIFLPQIWELNSVAECNRYFKPKLTHIQEEDESQISFHCIFHHQEMHRGIKSG